MLYRLSLRNNLIADVSYNASLFAPKAHLSITSTCCQLQWDSINQLAILPSLANLKFKENPLSTSKNSEAM